MKNIDQKGEINILHTKRSINDCLICRPFSLFGPSNAWSSWSSSSTISGNGKFKSMHRLCNRIQHTMILLLFSGVKGKQPPLLCRHLLKKQNKILLYSWPSLTRAFDKTVSSTIRIFVTKVPIWLSLMTNQGKQELPTLLNWEGHINAIHCMKFQSNTCNLAAEI